MATVGLDTSAYKQGVEEAKAQTKETVAVMAKDYSKLYSEVLHLQAAYKKSLEETGKNSQATKDLKTKLSEAQAQLNSTSSALETAERYMNSFGDATGKASKANKSLAEELTASITKGMTLSNVILKAGSVALDAAKNFVQSGIQYNAQLESYTTGFTNMLGSAEAAKAAMDAIQEDAARTPFDVASLTQANRLLISAGENAGYSRKVIMALGDAISAAGGGNAELSRMSANLQQIANVGKATAVDIKQFAYAGINIYQVLADYTGKSVQDVQNMTVSYDLLSEALIAASEEGGRYYNAMDTQSQTMNGRVSTLKDNVNQLAGLMTGNLSEAVGTVISKLNDMTVAAIEAYRQDGWWGMAGAALSTIEPLDEVGQALDRIKEKANSALTHISYVINSLTVPNFTSVYGSEEAYASALESNARRSEESRERENKRRGYLHEQRVSQAQAAAAAAAVSSITGDASGGGSAKKTTTKHVAADTKKLADTIKETSQEILAGTGNIVGSIQRVVETADNTYNVYDGTTKELKGTTKETVQTITDSWTEVVDGVEKTIKKVTKNVTDADGKITTTVNQTCDKVVLSVTEMQKRIDKQLSEAQSQWKSGIMGTLQSTISDLKNGNWSGLATDFAKLVWGEVTQEQRDIISKWLTDALTAINDSYSGGGLSAAKDTIKALFGDGIAEGATEAGTAVKSFSQILDGLNASGGVGTKLAGIAGGFTNMAGTITKALSGIVGFLVSNPVVAVVLGLTALVGGAALSAWSKNKGEKLTNNYESPFSKTPVYDSLAEFSYRADQFNRYKGLTASPFSSGQQDTTGRQQLSVLQRISNSLDEHLPAIGTGTLVIDANGVQALAGAMQPTLVDGIDGDLGIRSTRKARGG